MNDSVFEALLNSHALAEFSVNGQILWANQNFLNLMGYEFCELSGRQYSFIQPEFDWNTLATGLPQTGEFPYITKNKDKVWVHSSYSPVRDEQNNIIKFLNIVIDITEKKSLAESLERKNRELKVVATKAHAATHAKSSFLANMSHEIRTPLNSIIGITDTLAETPLNERQSSFVEVLQRANHQLLTIINDILDLTKVESGELHLNLRPFNLKNVIDDVVSVFGLRAKEKGLQLHVAVDPDLEQSFIGDCDRLRQILNNLICNAIKFTHQGSVTLKVGKNHSSHPGNLHFRVSDSGIGIPRHMYKDIFRSFTQADTTTTRRYGGTGLGLSISQKMVELMNGHIWLESEIGTGSVFSFTTMMPPTKETITSSQNQIFGRFQLTDANHQFIGTNLKILVVDDVDDNRNLFEIYLQSSNHDIQYAESGVDAIRLIEGTDFDIIFMDVQMPEMDGHETTRLIRQLEQAQNRKPAKILACTANAFTEDVQKSIEAGCDLHLSKPIRKDTLIQAINSYLSPASSIPRYASI